MSLPPHIELAHALADAFADVSMDMVRKVREGGDPLMASSALTLSLMAKAFRKAGVAMTDKIERDAV